MSTQPTAEKDAPRTGWLDRLFAALDERDRRKDEARRRWRATPEGRAQAEEWRAEENRYGYR